MKKAISVLLIMTVVLMCFVGCSSDSEHTLTTDKQDNISDTVPEENHTVTKTEMFTDRDYKTDYDENTAVRITLNGTTAVSDSDNVTISGSTITVTEEATYIVSGELNEGMLIVDAPDTAKLQLVLNGVNITSKTSAALYIRESDKVFVTLADGTTNTLSNGGGFTAIDDNKIDGTLFSEQDLTLNGSGSLMIVSPVGHGIVCKDDLVITSGAYTVNAASHGLDVNDSVRITNAALTVDTGKDAVHCENSEDTAKGFVYIADGKVKAEAEGDGISASAYVQIEGGTIDMLTGGGSENGSKVHSDNFGGFMGGGHGDARQNMPQNYTVESEEESTSMKGLKAAGDILISKGNFTIHSADDSIHADASINISGGTFTIASGDDAVHAEDTLTIAAGELHISECYEGLEALCIDVKGGNIKLNASDDGLNAAGGMDQSGTEGGRDGMFGEPGHMGGGRPGSHGGVSSGSNGSITISGGSLYICSFGDGIDVNGTLEITGGHTTVVGPVQGDTATLDYDISATITGGTFIGTGASGMAQTFSDSDQGVIAVSVGNQDADTKILLTDSSGKLIMEYTPKLDFAVVIFSSPDMKKGEIYTITVGTESGEFEAV